MQKLKLTEKEKKEIKQEIDNNLNKMFAKNEIETITISPKEYIKTKLKKDKMIKPQIIIESEVLEKMHALVQAPSIECQWHGLVKRDKEKQIYIIYDILVFPQENSATRTDTDTKKYEDWIMNIMQDEEHPEVFDDMRMHGHSHVNMSVFSSAIDDTYQKELLTNIKDDDYYLFMVFNKKREICILLYDYTTNMLYETADVDLKVVTHDMTDISEWAEKQIKEFCETKTYTAYGYYGRTKQSSIKNPYEGLDFGCGYFY